MAGNLSYLRINNDSPEVGYFPSVNLEPSPNITNGWELLYSGSGAAVAPGEVGVGTSYHYTSLNGTSLMIQWNGTGIDLVGSAYNASYSIALDGNSLPSSSYNGTHTVLASLDDLENAQHTLLLTTLITTPNTPNAFLTFDEAIIAYAPPLTTENDTATSYNIDDPDVAFMGHWSYLTDSAGTQMHVSTTAGDRAETTFAGSAITVYGLVSSFSGRYSVTIDNITTTYSAQSSYNNSAALLFFATGLSQESLHQLSVVNEDNRTFAVKVGGMNVTAFGTVKSSTAGSSLSISNSPGTIAALVLAAVLVLLLSAISYRYFVRRRNSHRMRRPIPRHRTWDEKNYLDSHRFTDHGLLPGEEDLESNSLSASKGYGFGLGIRRGFPFAYRKAKSKSNSNGKSSQLAPYESHQMTPQYDHDDKRLSLSTLAAELPVLSYVPESEKLAPGWTNPVTRILHPSEPRTSIAGRVPLIPELRVEDVGSDDGDDDAKTLTSRQGEALAATLSLSPRTSEVPFSFGFPPSGLDVPGDREPRRLERDDSFLQVRETSPFRLDVGAIFTSLKGKRDSRSTSGSARSSWSKVRARLYRKAHKDDGRQSSHTYPMESSSSSGPESVPVVMHKSGSDAPPSDTAPVSGTYSFLDFTSSRPSFRRQSKSNTTNTVSSAPAENGHDGDLSGSNENTSIRIVRVERNGTDDDVPKPDVPSTASPRSNTLSPLHYSNGYANTRGSIPFPFPITIPPSAHMPHPFNTIVLEEERNPSSPTLPSPLHDPVEQPRVLVNPPPESLSADPHSPTESVPLSVSDIHFRHSFSDYTTIDSRRTSANSALPPHPPLPHREGSSSVPPAHTFPPPYIVQRVLGLTPLGVPTPAARVARQYPSSATDPIPYVTTTLRRPGTAPSSAPPFRPAFRGGGIVGPRPRPPTSGSTRSSTTLQLPLQGGREGFKGPR
ncbi:hypothetical protein V8B97DRAFT_1245781 [Scleroderma yunnanense]